MAQSRTRKMVNLDIEETSGVDHPAHLHDGWLVMKAADPADVQRVLDSSVPKEDSVEKSAEERLEEALEALRKAEERIEEMENAAKEETAEEETVEESAEDLMKSAPEPVAKAFAEMKKQADEAVAKAAEIEAVLKAERDARADAEAIEKAKSWSHLSLDASTVGPALRRLAETDEELAKSVTSVLESVNAQAESANIFAELGASSATSGDAFTQMETLAKAAVADGKATTMEQAFVEIASSNPNLYAQYLAEKGA